ncbi:MAG: hybrid sensor histidine kinase/response regulator [Desulfobacterales bacterium]|nr:hybrid sensor histidine kinase/response regulator [Desulfobacterales bacterium]
MSSGNDTDLSEMSMLDLFRMEAETQCNALNNDLVALEQQPGSAMRLESLMRAAHSLKGAARIVGLDQAVKVAHTMEDVFVAAQTDEITLDRAGIDLLLKGVDILSDIAKLSDQEAAAWFSAHAGEIDALAASFIALAKGEMQPAPDKPLKQALKKKEPEKKAKAAPAPDKPEETAPKPDKPEVGSARPAKKTAAEATTRAVRISAENMNRLMGLAGEVLIESRWLPSFTSELLRLKQKQDELLRLTDRILADGSTTDSGKLASTYITELHRKINACRSMLADNLTIIEDHARHAGEISHRLYHELIASRMQPFSEGTKGFARMIRDISRELGKEVKFQLVGEDTPVDRDILEKIEAPLNHLLRNAIDHGIECPEERERAGKPREGTLRLEARHRAGMLNIVVADDGRGIDMEKLRRTVVKRNLVSRAMAADLSESELMEFLFLPNFSTRKKVSNISGRGVGLDVVHSVVNEVRGVVRGTSRLHRGSRFELQLPLTLSVMRALLTEINDEPYALPLVSIDYVLRLPKNMIKTVEGRQYFTFNDKRVGLVSAQQLLNKPNIRPPDDKDFRVAIFNGRPHQYGLIMDRFLGVRDLVVQPLNPRLGKIKDISAAAILEDGTPVLIMDVEDMVRSMDLLISGNRLRQISSDETSGASPEENINKRILVADDSITVREVERKVLLAKGYEVDVAIDGMDAWNTLRNGKYDLVVTDVDMPRMDGIKLVTMIKEDPHFCSTPVIIISYKDREEDRNRGLEAGADYYLTKGSFHDQTLIRAVEDLIGPPTPTNSTVI